MKLFAGSLAVLICIFSSNAFACSCRPSSFEENFKRASLVVTAIVVKPVDTDKVLLHFDEIWKGSAPTEVTVTLETGLTSSCGSTGHIQPPKGTKFLFYLGKLATDGTGIIHLTPCGRILTYDKAQQDIPKLEAYRDDVKKLDAEIAKTTDAKNAQLKKIQFLHMHGDILAAEKALDVLTKTYPDYVAAWEEYAELEFEQAEATLVYGKEMAELEERKKAFSTRALNFADKTISLDKANKHAKDIQTIALIQLGRMEETNLIGADLSSRQIHYKDFKEKELNQTILDKATLWGIEFSNAKLNGVSALGTQFIRVKFTGSSFDSSVFDEASISDGGSANGDNVIKFKAGGFENCSITHSSFKKTRLNAPMMNTKVENSDFEGAGFEGTYNKENQMLMANVTAKDSNFRKIRTSSQFGRSAEIRDSVFDHCDFSEAKIAAKLTNVNFSTSTLDTVDFSGASYDCQTKWPVGFNPSKHGATQESSCNGGAMTPPDFSHKTLDSKNFGGLNLTGSSFAHSKLPNANFYEAVLINVDFTGADIQNADFRKANLEGARFNNTSLYGVNFEGANLKNTDFTGTEFSNARFGKNDNLNEANIALARITPEGIKRLPDTIKSDNVQFIYWANNNHNDACLKLPHKQIDMTGKDLTGINLSYSCLNGDILSNAVFNKGSLYDTDLRGAKLNGSSFKGAIYGCQTVFDDEYSNITEQMILIETMGSCYGNGKKVTRLKTRLPGADLTEMNLRYAQLKDADLQNANLSGAILESANMTGANMTGAILKGAIYNQSTKWPEHFDYTKAGAILAAPLNGAIEMGQP